MVYQGGETTDGRRIYVGNINYDCREDEVRNAFNEVRPTKKQGTAYGAHSSHLAPIISF